jgi:signal transduction histidine kinase
MSERSARWLAWGIWTLVLALLVFVFVLGALNDTEVTAEQLFFVPLALLATMTSATVGGLVASRQPRNPLGWLFLGLSLCVVLGLMGEGYPIYAILTNPGSLPAPEWVAWMSGWTFSIAGAAVPLIILLFPSGTVPSRRWRVIPWLLIGGTLWALAWYAVEVPHLSPAPGLDVRNPVAIEGIRAIASPLITAGAIVALVSAIACFVGLILRFRRSRGEERQQLRWLAYVGLFTLVVFVAMFALEPIMKGATPVEDIFWMLFVVSLTIGIPVACGIAILKYRLYDLDVVIKKTVVFAILAGFVTLVYVGVVVGIGTLVTGASAGFSVLVFGAIALVALILQPLRQWARRVADRLVYGKRATPYEVLSQFTERIGETLSVEDVLARMTSLITAGTGADRAEVWLRVGRELRLEASSPSREGNDRPHLPLGAQDETPDIPEATRVIPVRHRSELLGAIAVSVPAADPLTPEQERMLSELAAQAGLVLRNVGLTAELRARLEELQRSRQRLVAAQDEARRRIERNLHDGAQQQLVALTVKARLAQQLADRDPNASTAMLDDIQRDAEAALDELRDLARGIYPPLLADQGLRAALEAQARKASLPVTVDMAVDARYPEVVEAAMYFCCLEALNNITKYAEASYATIRIAPDDGYLRFEVADDGQGFDVTATSHGTGLQGMADRLDAVGGRIEVRSVPGAGTTIIGTVAVGQTSSKETVDFITTTAR